MKALLSKAFALEETYSEYNHLKIEQGATGAAIGRGEGVAHGSAKRVCTGYNSVFCAQASSYSNRLNAVLGDAQERGNCVRGSPICVGGDGKLLHLGDEGSGDSLGRRTNPSEGGGRGDVVVPVPPLTWTS